MTRRKDDEKREREVGLWLEKRRIPPQRYRNLPNHLKEVLRNLVCIPTRTTSPHQRKELYTKLCLSPVGGRDSPNPVDFMPDEKIDEFFTPFSPSETLSHWEKY